MKALLALLSLSLLFTSAIYAGYRDKLVGTWKGSTVYSLKGSDTTRTIRCTMKIKAFGTRGYISRKTQTIDGSQLITTAYHFDSGRMTGETTDGGVVASTATGTWQVSGNTEYSKVTVMTPTGSAKQEAKSTLVDANTIKTFATSAMGITAKSRLHKQ